MSIKIGTKNCQFLRKPIDISHNFHFFLFKNRKKNIIQIHVECKFQLQIKSDVRSHRMRVSMCWKWIVIVFSISVFYFHLILFDSPSSISHTYSMKSLLLMFFSLQLIFSFPKKVRSAATTATVITKCANISGIINIKIIIIVLQHSTRHTRKNNI